MILHKISGYFTKFESLGHGWWHQISAEKFPPKFCKTLTGRLPLKDGSDRPQTLGKRVSDDLQLSIFQVRKKKFDAQKKLSKHIFFSITAFFGRFGLAKVGIGTSVVQNHCLGCDFQVSTMLHRREPSAFVFCSLTLGEKKLHKRGGGPTKKLQFFFQELMFFEDLA